MTTEQDPRIVYFAYKGYILGCKKKYGTSRGLIYRRQILQAYVDARRRLHDAGTSTSQQARLAWLEEWFPKKKPSASSETTQHSVRRRDHAVPR